MQPVLFRIPVLDWPVFSYGVMIMIGFIVAIAYASWRARREGIDPNTILDIGLYAVVAGILGARAMYYWEFFEKKMLVQVPEGTPGAFPGVVGGQEVFLKHLSFSERPWYVFFYIHEGGIVFYGGLLLATLVIVFYLWSTNRRRARLGQEPLPLLRVCDILACAVPIGLSFGRLGCFLNGCCWGMRAGPNALLRIQFPAGSPAWEAHVKNYGLSSAAEHCYPVHATQLYEWGGALLIAAALFLLYRYHTRDGQLFALLAVLYGPVRYVIEGLREHDPNAERIGIAARWVVDPIAGAPMTNSQLVSIGVFAAGVLGLAAASVWGRRYVPGERAAAPAEKGKGAGLAARPR